MQSLRCYSLSGLEWRQGRKLTIMASSKKKKNGNSVDITLLFFIIIILTNANVQSWREE